MDCRIRGSTLPKYFGNYIFSIVGGIITEPQLFQNKFGKHVVLSGPTLNRAS